MPQITGSVVQYPARVSLAWFLTLIGLGGAILMHPACRRPEAPPLSALDAVFMAASASCVTGLSVRSLEYDLSLAGQAVLLALVQLGGIGIMTITSFVLFRRRRQSLRQRAMMSEIAGVDEAADLRRILASVLLLTFSFEGLGAVVLWLAHIGQGAPLQAAWVALFHSVSAFCNAGFSLYDANLVRYQENAPVILTLSVLIVVGGIGFPVLLDLGRRLERGRPGYWARLHLHTKLVLIGTAVLIGLGLGSFLLLEWDGALLGKSLKARLLIGVMQAVTPRTAGFNAVAMQELSNATLFTTMLLMLVGGSPGSTAGGFKVSTLMILVLRAWATFRGWSRLNVFRRTVPREAVERAIVTVMLFAVVATVGLTVILVLEQSEQPHPESKGLFMDAAFEVVSALGTVGLSVGMTPLLTAPGKVVIILLMLVGRLGPLTLFIAISMSQRREPYEYPTEELLFG